MKTRYTYISTLLVLLFMFSFSCSNKRNTFASRQYHDVTAYFNVLFNGKDAFKHGVKKAEKIEPTGFDEILPVFLFEFEEVPGLISSDMQRTIEKTKKTVEKHSITAKPKRKKGMTKEDRDFYNKKEFNIFIDNAYLLMGQANAFLRDYDEARKALEYAELEYPKESSIHETRLWLAIIQVQQGDIATAENSLKVLERDKNFPENLVTTLNAAWASLRIKQKNYSEAINYLKKSLEKAKGKTTKIRYNYILAQLNEQTGNKSEALNYYDKVLKMNPPYFTAFNAQMAKAFSYDSLTQKSDIRKILEKALKDNRNEEYLDQIYYALATIEKADNNIDKALEYYQKSISANGFNNRQKALSYNALANYYYDLPDYVKAYHYYDSSAKLIGTEHSRYEDISERVRQLRKLAENLEIIQTQDSLQKIAQLPESERNKLIDARIEQAMATEKAQQDELHKRQESIRQANLNSSMNQNTSKASGQWYFYNTTALNLGLSDFEMRWGRRKLEDNWRRRNKGLQIQEEELEQGYENSKQSLTLSEAEKQKKQLSEKDKEYYLVNVPVGDEDMKVSNDKVQNAMFNVGEAYRDDLHNYTTAIKAFEDLNNRYPNSVLQPQAYIALYNLYTQQEDNDKATYYKNLMAQMYPNNLQVKAALDPDYIVQLQAEETAAEGAYMAAIYQYSQGNYIQALQMANQVINNEPNNRLLPQYHLLRVLSSDYGGDTTKYTKTISELIEKYPDSDVAKQAKSLLANLNMKDDFSSIVSEPEKEQEPVIVNYSQTDGEHYFAVFVNNKDNINELKFNITARNADFYLNENYDVTEEDFGTNNKLILVGVLRNKESAMKYYIEIINDESNIFNGQSSSSYKVCIISDINLFLLRNSKYFPGYYEFFQKNYLK